MPGANDSHGVFVRFSIDNSRVMQTASAVETIIPILLRRCPQSPSVSVLPIMPGELERINDVASESQLPNESWVRQSYN